MQFDDQVPLLRPTSIEVKIRPIITWVVSFFSAPSSILHLTDIWSNWTDGTLIGIILMGMVASPAYAYLLMRENNKRAIYRAEQLALPEEERRVYTNKELREMGDRAPDFIYTI